MVFSQLFIKILRKRAFIQPSQVKRVTLKKVPRRMVWVILSLCHLMCWIKIKYIDCSRICELLSVFPLQHTYSCFHVILLNNKFFCHKAKQYNISKIIARQKRRLILNEKRNFGMFYYTIDVIFFVVYLYTYQCSTLIYN